MELLSDTAPEVERRLFAAYRRMPPWRKMQLVADAFTGARQLHAAGYRLRQPGATPAEVNRAWALMTAGPGPWIERMRFDSMSQGAEQIQATQYALSVLESLNIRYAVGGSLASSAHGQARYTQDADVMVEPFPGKERLFALRFPAEEYYTDEQMISDALARRGSFNVLHLPTAFKLDFFVQKDRPFEREVLARRALAPLFGEAAGLFGLVTAEDAVLLKLEWFRLGGEVSDRQWADVLGVMKTQAGRLDAGYLEKWAADLGVGDLLEKARGQCGPSD